MLSVSFSLIPVVAGAVISMVVGAAWYSSLLFGNQWMKLIGMSKQKMKSLQKEMGKMYMMGMISALIQAFVMYNAITMLGLNSFMDGATLGFMVWLGFIAPTLFNAVLYEQQPYELFYIHAGYQFVTALALGGVIASL